MKAFTRFFTIFLMVTSLEIFAQDTAIVIPHDDLKVFGYSQNKIFGISTAGMGAQEIEVWQSSLGPGDHTPRHKHDCEEVFIFLKGEGRVNIGDEDVYFKAPCTVIVPADIEHEVFNLSSEPTVHFTVLRIGSTIWDVQGKAMNLPWRN